MGKTISGRLWPVCLYSLPSGSPRFCCPAGAAGFCSITAFTGGFFTDCFTVKEDFDVKAFDIEVFDITGFFADFACFVAFFTIDEFFDTADFFAAFTGFADFFTVFFATAFDCFLTVFLIKGFAAAFFVVFNVFLEGAAFTFFTLTGFFIFFTVLPFEVLFFTVLTLIENINI